MVVARPEAQQVGSFGPYQYSATTIRPSTHLTLPSSGTCDRFAVRLARRDQPHRAYASGRAAEDDIRKADLTVRGPAVVGAHDVNRGRGPDAAKLAIGHVVRGRDANEVGV